MPVQGQDLPRFRDVLHILTQIPGPASQWFQYLITDILLSDNPGSRANQPLDDADYHQFRDACRVLIQNEEHGIRQSVNQTTLSACIQLAILLGQYEDDCASVTGSPNSFAYEIEFLGSVMPNSAPHTPGAVQYSRESATLKALQFARRLRILREYDLLAGSLIGSGRTVESFRSEPGFRLLFLAEWISVKGKFIYSYDRQFVEGVAQQLRSSGCDHPDLRPLSVAISNCLYKWERIVNDFRRRIIGSGGVLESAMLSKALLPWSAEELTTYECVQLAETSPALVMSHGELFAGAIPRQARDAYSWLDG